MRIYFIVQALWYRVCCIITLCPLVPLSSFLVVIQTRCSISRTHLYLRKTRVLITAEASLFIPRRSRCRYDAATEYCLQILKIGWTSRRNDDYGQVRLHITARVQRFQRSFIYYKWSAVTVSQSQHAHHVEPKFWHCHSLVQTLQRTEADIVEIGAIWMSSVHDDVCALVLADMFPRWGGGDSLTNYHHLQCVWLQGCVFIMLWAPAKKKTKISTLLKLYSNIH